LYMIYTVAVLCSANDKGHVHGSYHSCPFKVVLLGTYVGHGDQLVKGVYSPTPPYGVISPQQFFQISICMDIFSSSTLVGSTLYWSSGSVIIAFDSDKQRLAAIKKPFRVKRGDNVRMAEDGGLGLAAFQGSDHNKRCLKIWETNPNTYGAATWVLRNFVVPQKIFGDYIWGLQGETLGPLLLAYRRPTVEGGLSATAVPRRVRCLRTMRYAWCLRRQPCPALDGRRHGGPT
jgi:hypothetical protein